MLAEKVSLSTVHMSYIETGDMKLSLPVPIAFANILGVRSDKFLNDRSLLLHRSSIDGIMRILDSDAKATANNGRCFTRYTNIAQKAFMIFALSSLLITKYKKETGHTVVR